MLDLEEIAESNARLWKRILELIPQSSLLQGCPEAVSIFAHSISPYITWSEQRESGWHGIQERRARKVIIQRFAADLASRRLRNLWRIKLSAKDIDAFRKFAASLDETDSHGGENDE